MSLLGPYVCVSWAIRNQSGFLAVSASARAAGTRLELPLKQRNRASRSAQMGWLVVKEAFRRGGSTWMKKKNKRRKEMCLLFKALFV